MSLLQSNKSRDYEMDIMLPPPTHKETVSFHTLFNGRFNYDHKIRVEISRNIKSKTMGRMAVSLDKCDNSEFYS